MIKLIYLNTCCQVPRCIAEVLAVDMESSSEKWCCGLYEGTGVSQTLILLHSPGDVSRISSCWRLIYCWENRLIEQREMPPKETRHVQITRAHTYLIKAMKFESDSIAIFKSPCAALWSLHDATRKATDCSPFSIHLYTTRRMMRVGTKR